MNESTQMHAEILLVDDNPIQTATRQAILSLRGRRVAVANGSYQALELLESPDLCASVGLIITDHWMPDLNGPQLVTFLRRRLPTIPILVISGMPDAEHEYAGLGIIYRTKPIGPEDLLALVDSLLNEPMSRTA